MGSSPIGVAWDREKSSCRYFASCFAFSHSVILLVKEGNVVVTEG